MMLQFGKSQSLAVEFLVQPKMQQRELIILGLEDYRDWSNASTRRVVMKVCQPYLIVSYLSCLPKFYLFPGLIYVVSFFPWTCGTSLYNQNVLINKCFLTMNILKF